MSKPFTRINSFNGVLTLVLLFSFLRPGHLQAQYFPMPKPVPPDSEPALLKEFQSGLSDVRRADVLLQLANIDYLKGVRAKDDLPLAMQYAEQAANISKKHNDLSHYDTALYNIAIISIFQDSLQKAETLLLQFHDPVLKNSLQIALGWTYFVRPSGTIEVSEKKGSQYIRDAVSSLHV